MGTLVCFFLMVETILLMWSASGMAELVILPPAGEWPRAVDGEESCPSWMSLIGGEQWTSPSGCLPSTSVIILQHLSSHSVGCLIVFIIRSHLLSFKWKFLM